MFRRPRGRETLGIVPSTEPIYDEKRAEVLRLPEDGEPIRIAYLQGVGISQYLQVSIPFVIMDREGGLYVLNNTTQDDTKVVITEGFDENTLMMSYQPVYDRLYYEGELKPGDTVVDHGSADQVQVPMLNAPIHADGRVTEVEADVLMEGVSFYADYEPQVIAQDPQDDPIIANPAVYITPEEITGPPPPHLPRVGTMLSKRFNGRTDQFQIPIGVSLIGSNTPIIARRVEVVTSITGGIRHVLHVPFFFVDDFAQSNLVMKVSWIGASGFDTLPGVVEFDKTIRLIKLRRIQNRSAIPMSCLAARGAYAVGASALRSMGVEVPGFGEYVAGVLGIPGYRSTAVSDFSNFAFSCTQPAGYFSLNDIDRSVSYTGTEPADTMPDPIDDPFLGEEPRAGPPLLIGPDDLDLYDDLFGDDEVV
jgi:hypothetical protein